jgi:predicted ArsR family transcriptional regulator
MIDAPLSVSPDDPLSQTTRARLFALLGELGRPADTAELAQHLALHPNGVRTHLERLEHAGLLVRDRARQARGRPRDVWRIAPDARPGGQPPRAYADLGRWLARAMRSRTGGLRGVEATGRRIGRELAKRDSGSTLEVSLATLGFQPRVALREADRLTFCLANCPYSDVVPENPPVICTLHRGITRGLLDVLEPHAKLAGFIPRDPEEAGCLIELSGFRAVPEAT